MALLVKMAVSLSWIVASRTVHVVKAVREFQIYSRPRVESFSVRFSGMTRSSAVSSERGCYPSMADGRRLTADDRLMDIGHLSREHGPAYRCSGALKLLAR